MPKISVIIPVHNAEKYLSSCLNSVLNQTEQDIEVLAIHDHSTDNSLNILKQFEKQHPHKLKVIDMLDHYGVSAARNKGLELAQGDYIGFVDADDVISLNMYEVFYKLSKAYQVPVVVGNCFRIRSDEMLENHEFYGLENKFPKIITYTKMPLKFFDETPAVWDKLFQHDFLESTKFLEGYVYEDISFTYPLLLKANTVVSISRDDYAYRMTPNSIMTKELKPDKHILDIIEVVQNAKENSLRYQLDKEKLNLLQDKLKLCLIRKMGRVEDWDISERDKIFLLNRIGSIFKYKEGDLRNFSSFYAMFVAPFFLPFHDLEIQNDRELTFQIESVKKRIHLLQKRV